MSLDLRVYLHGAGETTRMEKVKASKCLGFQPARGCANGKFLLCVRGPPGPGDSHPSQTCRPHCLFRQHFPAPARIHPGPYQRSFWKSGELCGAQAQESFLCPRSWAAAEWAEIERVVGQWEARVQPQSALNLSLWPRSHHVPYSGPQDSHLCSAWGAQGGLESSLPQHSTGGNLYSFRDSTSASGEAKAPFMGRTWELAETALRDLNSWC